MYDSWEYGWKSCWWIMMVGLLALEISAIAWSYGSWSIGDEISGWKLKFLGLLGLKNSATWFKRMVMNDWLVV